MLVMLMRSAESEPQSEGKRDSDRCVAESGRGDAVSAAMFIRSLGIEPKTILCSPFRRTRDTAEIVSQNLSDPVPIQVAPSIMPGAGVEELMRAIKSRTECDEEEWILTVGHEPDIGMTIREVLKSSGSYNVPIDSGQIIGLNLRCVEGQISGCIIFSFSAQAMRS